ncbi:hypothetical protein [Streptomyces lavendofoliae]|uniref:hypothetical protein n=1 Tax=Streptomyces lavendofoliae TaxID=67314 RepID=UPI003D94AF43
MDIKPARCLIAVDDHDEAPAFSREVLGPEVRGDAGFEGTPPAGAPPGRPPGRPTRRPSRTRP